MTATDAAPAGRLSLLPTLLLLALCALFFAQPIADSDLFWHLASGHQILTAGAIPTTDPFGVYQVDNYWSATVLQGQWLGQLALAAADNIAGLNGIIALRALLLTLCVLIVFNRAKKVSDHQIVPLILALLVLAILRGHTGERPQLFSFALFAITIAVLEHAYAEGHYKHLWLIPPLFLLWANLHPGVLLGVVVLVLFTSIALAQAWFRKALSIELKMLFGVTLAAAIAALLTPNGFTSIEYLLRLEADPIQSRVIEYLSPLQLLSQIRLVHNLPFVALLIALSLPALWMLVIRRQFAHLATALFLIGAGLSTYRYLPFTAIYIAMLAPLGLQLGKPKISVMRWTTSTMVVLLLLAVFLWPALPRLPRGGYETSLYPTAAIDTLEEKEVRGRLFNSLRWGGFLLWRLHPQILPFIDGRLMDRDRTIDYTHILWQTDHGKRRFQSGEFNAVLVSPSNHLAVDATIYPLVTRLSNDPGWRTVYRDQSAILFVRSAITAPLTRERKQ